MDALDRPVTDSDRYPFLLQVWGRTVWSIATSNRVDVAMAAEASMMALDELETGFYPARYARTTERERGYLDAMASLGRGPSGSGAVAAAAGSSQKAMSKWRDRLIRRGLIDAPARGSVDFTVPHFADHLRRRAQRERQAAA